MTVHTCDGRTSLSEERSGGVVRRSLPLEFREAFLNAAYRLTLPGTGAQRAAATKRGGTRRSAADPIRTSQSATVRISPRPWPRAARQRLNHRTGRYLARSSPAGAHDEGSGEHGGLTPEPEQRCRVRRSAVARPHPHRRRIRARAVPRLRKIISLACRRRNRHRRCPATALRLPHLRRAVPPVR